MTQSLSKKNILKTYAMFFIVFLYPLATRAKPSNQKLTKTKPKQEPTAFQQKSSTLQKNKHPEAIVSQSTKIQEKNVVPETVAKNDKAQRRALIKKTYKRRNTSMTPEERRIRMTWVLSIVPGLGQIYNGEPWKAPIIWGGLGFLSWLYYDYYPKKYKKAKEDVKEGSIDAKEMLSIRRNMRLSQVALVFFYALNIVEAYAGAHLKAFDVSDDLAVKVKPEITPKSTGVSVSLEKK